MGCVLGRPPSLVMPWKNAPHRLFFFRRFASSRVYSKGETGVVVMRAEGTCLWVVRALGRAYVPRVLFAVILLGVAAPTHGDRVIFVKADAQGESTGTSWTHAYVDLQEALDEARVGGDVGTEIWIAAGTYKPDRATGDQALAFELFGRVGLYGGFGAWEECREERDPEGNLTILSGDLNGDDDPDAQSTSDCCDWQSRECSDENCLAAVDLADASCTTRWDQSCSALAVSLCCELCRPTSCDNSYNVLRATEPGSAPVLDGLTLTAGKAMLWPAHPYGGGLLSINSSPSIVGCRLVRNEAFAGSAMISDGGTPVLERSSFTDNGRFVVSWDAVQIRFPEKPLYLRHLTLARNAGGGLGLISADAIIENSTIRDTLGTGLSCHSSDCTVIDSQIVGSSDHGMYAYGFTRIINSQFLRNSFKGLFADGPTFIINSVFAGNTAGSAAAVDSRPGGLYVLHSVFFGNTADLIAGIGVGDGGATIRNSIFWGNSDNTGFTDLAQFRGASTTVINVSNSIVQGWTGYYGGVGNSGVDPLFVDADGADDIVGTEDDDVRLSPDSPAINAGDPDPAGLPATDLDGHARVLCGRVDIGAYEFGIGDYNCDRTVDLIDFAYWSECATGPHSGPYGPGCESFDFDADGAVDLLDFAALQVTWPPP